MDHLFHKNILQEKNNLEWQLAEANAKIEKLQRTISSLQEKKQIGGLQWPTWLPSNAPGYAPPIQGEDGRWYSPKPKNPHKPLPKPRGLDSWDWGGSPEDESPLGSGDESGPNHTDSGE